MSGRHPTPVETARAVVLGEVVAALNAADGRGQRLHSTSVADYRQAIVKALSPIGPRSAAPLSGVDPDSNVVDLWGENQHRA